MSQALRDKQVMPTKTFKIKATFEYTDWLPVMADSEEEALISALAFWKECPNLKRVLKIEAEEATI